MTPFFRITDFCLSYHKKFSNLFRIYYRAYLEPLEPRDVEIELFLILENY